MRIPGATGRAAPPCPVAERSRGGRAWTPRPARGAVQIVIPVRAHRTARTVFSGPAAPLFAGPSPGRRRTPPSAMARNAR